MLRVPESKGQTLYLESKSKEQQQEKQDPIQKEEPKWVCPFYNCLGPSRIQLNWMLPPHTEYKSSLFSLPTYTFPFETSAEKHTEEFNSLQGIPQSRDITIHKPDYLIPKLNIFFFQTSQLLLLFLFEAPLYSWWCNSQLILNISWDYLPWFIEYMRQYKAYP